MFVVLVSDKLSFQIGTIFCNVVIIFAHWTLSASGVRSGTGEHCILSVWRLKQKKAIWNRYFVYVVTRKKNVFLLLLYLEDEENYLQLQSQNVTVPLLQPNVRLWEKLDFSKDGSKEKIALTDCFLCLFVCYFTGGVFFKDGTHGRCSHWL